MVELCLVSHSISLCVLPNFWFINPAHSQPGSQDR